MELFKEFELVIFRNDISISFIGVVIRNYVYGVNMVVNLNVQVYLWERVFGNVGNFYFFVWICISLYQFYYRKVEVIDFGEKFF